MPRTAAHRWMIRAFLLLLPAAAAAGAAGSGVSWRQVHPYWRDAYVFSFRSPDLLTHDADERWGAADYRLVCGDVLHDFPAWLDDQQPDVERALAEGRPVLLSLLFHSGYGTGLVTYSDDLSRAQVATYPWLVRQLLKHGLDSPRVTVTVDTCNSQAAAAHQLRPDLFRGGPLDWPPFRSWRAASAVRKKLPLPEAYRIFAQDRVAAHLSGRAKGRRAYVEAVPLEPLTRAERLQFRGRMYGQRGVIWGTPAFFNVLRLGPDPRGTNTADLFTAQLDGRVVDAYLPQNRAEFRRFREFGFLAAAGSAEPADPAAEPAPRRAAVQKTETAGTSLPLAGHRPAAPMGD